MSASAELGKSPTNASSSAAVARLVRRVRHETGVRPVHSCSDLMRGHRRGKGVSRSEVYVGRRLYTFALTMQAQKMALASHAMRLLLEEGGHARGAP